MVIIILVLAVTGLIIFLGVFFSQKAVVKRKLRNAVSKRIGDFKDGEIAKITGTVEFVGKPLLAPLSNRPCAYYYVHIEKKVSTGKSSHWKTLIKEEVSVKFVVKDGTYYAYIDDANPKTYIVRDRTYKSGFFNDATDHLENYLKSHGHSSENLLGFNKTIRYREGILEEGEAVEVYGKGEWKYADEFHLPKPYDVLLVITSPPNDSVYLSDDLTSV